MKIVLTLAIIGFALPAAAQSCIDEKMTDLENQLGEAQPLSVAGNIDLDGCSTPDFPEVNKCGESRSATKPVILTAPEGYSLNRATVLTTMTHNASERYRIDEVSYLTSEDGATRAASVNIHCTKENRLGGGGCEISIALSGTAEPFIGRDALERVIEECRAQDQ